MKERWPQGTHRSGHQRPPKSQGSASPPPKGPVGQSLSTRSQNAPDPSDLELVGIRGETNPIGVIKMAGKCLVMGLDGTWLLRAHAHALDAL